jgi:2'-phosphotransferase
LSLLLRHAAEKEGVKMNAQGYANVADVVCFDYVQNLQKKSKIMVTDN